MSDFSMGILVLKRDEEKLKAKLDMFQCKTITKDINDKWMGLFIEDQYLEEDSTNECIFEISKQIPLMNFIDFDDHGWGYKVFTNGKGAADLWVSYEIEFEVAQEIFEEEYPEDDFMDVYMSDGIGEILDDAIKSERYISRCNENIGKRNVESLKLFDIEDNIIAQIQDMLEEKHFLNELYYGSHNLRDKFKELIGIEDFEWMSFDYLTDEDE